MKGTRLQQQRFTLTQKKKQIAGRTGADIFNAGFFASDLTRESTFQTGLTWNPKVEYTYVEQQLLDSRSRLQRLIRAGPE